MTALVKVEGVSKKFCRSLKRSLWYGVKDMALEAAGGSRGHDVLRADEFWAVRDASFELKRGECLGIVGRNGAGKTTLLKMLNGLIKPDQGRIEMRGRVGALIALGAGFNPVLTGRENIYVNGSVLGLAKKEIDAKLEEIIDFAGTRDFIDAPVQSYSSGMQVRLGFAIATALQPDVLLLDEILAVGDAEFRARCYNRIGSLQKQAAVIFVSHSMDQIARMSSKVMVMAEGRVACIGTPEEGIAAYEAMQPKHAGEDRSFMAVTEPFAAARVELVSDRIRWDEPLELDVWIDSTRAVEQPGFYGALYDPAGAIVASFVVEGPQSARIDPGSNRVRLRIDRAPLAAGSYKLGLSVHPPGNMTNLLWSYKQLGLEIHSGPSGFSPCRLRARLEHHACQSA